MALLDPKDMNAAALPITDQGSQANLQTSALQVEALTVVLDKSDGSEVPVIEDVSFALRPGEVMGLVGESGCGKSVTAQAIMGVLPRDMRIKSGRVLLGGNDITALDKKAFNQVRGRDIAMIFQDPMTSLNPLITVGRQIAETLIVHKMATRAEANDSALELLRLVRIPSPEIRLREYPHRLSGGMRQRIMIAMALACEPSVIVADEPTTALDVTIQRQVLDLLEELQERLNVAVIMITHDFGIIREFAHSVSVMYAGKVVEQAAREALFRAPRHPYTQGLIAAMPHFDRVVEPGPRKTLVEIPGSVPALGKRGPGCHFQPRCPIATETCLSGQPPLDGLADDHAVACFHRRA